MVDPVETGEIGAELRLPIELPEQLQGLESLVHRWACNIQGVYPYDSSSNVDERSARLALAQLEHRVESNKALARIATNPDSIAFKLKLVMQDRGEL